ncbi:uncharacterized protein DEA37_0002674 [Paragonimus westermani]|uniref:Uncharacterized protein n=1 Tax=Paragonimus westermani TaxID=34504 RepID=A0A5J4NNU4_9TREM|nr:uncharacterized protein DEA37_0002674 [Paragonimus westermani]
MNDITTWTHPPNSHHHLFDCVIVGQRDNREVRFTRVKLYVERLKNCETWAAFLRAIAASPKDAPVSTTPEDMRQQFREQIRATATETMDNNAAISNLVREKNAAFASSTMDPDIEDKRAAFRSTRVRSQNQGRPVEEASAVQLARQSLRKESSAKRPMPAYDFIHYEQWLETKRADTMPNPPDPFVVPHAPNMLEQLGLYGDDNWKTRRRPFRLLPAMFRARSHSVGLSVARNVHKRLSLPLGHCADDTCRLVRSVPKCEVSFSSDKHLSEANQLPTSTTNEQTNNTLVLSVPLPLSCTRRTTR